MPDPPSILARFSPSSTPDTLYHGNNAIVYKCPPVVVKVVRRLPSQSRLDLVSAVSREFANLRAAHCKYVVSVLLLEQDNDGPVALVMPYYPLGDLHALLARARKRRHDLSPALKDYIFLQILKGVSHLHDLSIVHRDLKPANCLIGDDGIIKISDFGYSISNDAAFVDTVSRLGPLYLCCGTTSFKAPELFAYEASWPHVDVPAAALCLFSVDSWLLAILYMHVCTMTAPWSCSSKDLTRYAQFKSMYAQGATSMLRQINDKLVLLSRLLPLLLFRDLPYDSRPHLLALLDPCPVLRAKPLELVQSNWLKHAYSDPAELLELAKMS